MFPGGGDLFLVLYIVGRAVGLAHLVLHNKGIIPKIPLGEPLAMSFMWMPQAYIYTVSEECIPANYAKFLTKFS